MPRPARISAFSLKGGDLRTTPAKKHVSRKRNNEDLKERQKRITAMLTGGYQA